jgi:deoxyhypusine synthase
VSAVIAEGATALADAYESLGYRHYVPREAAADDRGAADALPAPSAEEWAAARAALRAMLCRTDDATASHVATALLGSALAASAPRPGILSSAAQRRVPVFAVGDSLLTQVGVVAVDTIADIAALKTVLARLGAGVVAFGTTDYTSQFIAATGTQPTIVAIAAPTFAHPTVSSAADATIALPVLATGLVQRLPQRQQVVVAPPESVLSRS